MRHLFLVLLSLTLAAAPSTAEQWERVKPDGLNFEAEFPGKPEFNEQTGDDGGKIRTYVIRSAAAVYDVTIWDISQGAVAPADVPQLLINMRDGSIAGVRGTLRTDEKIDISGHPARDVIADTMGMVWRARIVIANDRIYQAVAIISKTAETSEDTLRYLNSFKLLGDAAAPATK